MAEIGSFRTGIGGFNKADVLNYIDELNARHGEEVKEARNQDLLAVVNEIAIRKNRDLVGSVQEVLLEGPSKTNAARLSGRTSQNKPVMVDAAPDLAGEILPIRIEESTGFTLYGVPCPSRG